MRDIDFEGILALLEWSGMHVDEGEELAACPWCDEPEIQGSHLDGCRLEAALSVRRPAEWEPDGE